jgi:hypothetical protein
LPSFNRAALRASQTTSRFTCGFRRSCNQAAEVPSSKVSDRVPCSPWMNSTIVAAPRKSEPSRRAHQQATLLVVSLLLSDFRYRIAKCRYEKCGQYFFLKGKAREKVYAHGLFCSGRCNRAASAIRLTKQRRGRFNPTVIAWAAELLRQQKRKPGDDEIAKRKLLQQLNTRIRHHKDPNVREGRRRNHDGTYIALNWLTKHWDAIQEKMEEMSDAEK